MREYDSYKVFAQYRDDMQPYEPVAGRTYTVTHSDTTGQLFVFIGEGYAEDQVNEMRDEVRLAWIQTVNGPELTGSVLIGDDRRAAFRNSIFLSEMPLALQALREADRFLFMQYPELDGAPVYISFLSGNPAYHNIYAWGAIGDYRS